MVLEKLCSLVRIPAWSRSSNVIRLFLLPAPCTGLGFQSFGCSSSSVILVAAFAGLSIVIPLCIGSWDCLPQNSRSLQTQNQALMGS